MLTVAEFREAVRRVRGPAVRCPHCAGSLRQPQATVVIASRHCPHCGRRVLVEPADPGTPTLTADDVSALRAREDRLLRRLGWALVVAFPGLLLVLTMLALFHDTLLAALAPVVGEPAVKWGMTGFMLSPLLIGGGWMVVMAFRAEKQGDRCPHCPAGLMRQARLLTATGNCGGCGGRVVDRPAEPPAGPLLQLDDLRAAGQRAGRRVSRLLGGGLVGSLVMLAGFGVAIFSLGGPEAFWADVERRHGVMNAAYIHTAATVGGGLLVWGPLVGGVLWAMRVRSDTLCPHCGELVGGGWVVVASRCCPGCGRRVLAGPDPPG